MIGSLDRIAEGSPDAELVVHVDDTSMSAAPKSLNSHV